VTVLLNSRFRRVEFRQLGSGSVVYADSLEPGADGKGDNNGERCEQNERCWSHVYFFAFMSHGFPVASVGSDNLIRDERR